MVKQTKRDPVRKTSFARTHIAGLEDVSYTPLKRVLQPLYHDPEDQESETLVDSLFTG